MTKNELIEIVKETLPYIDKIESIVIQMMNEYYKDGAISDDDLYFLSDMAKLSRTYGNLVDQLPEVLKDEEPS